MKNRAPPKGSFAVCRTAFYCLSPPTTAKSRCRGCWTSCWTRKVSGFVSECIVVNNRSTDGTEAAVLAWMAAHPGTPVRLLRNNENYGLGGSHKVAFQYAVRHGYDYLVVLHGDDQGDARDLYPLMASGDYRSYDCCLGVPLHEGQPDQRLQRAAHLWQLRLQLAVQPGGPHKITDLGSGLNLYKVAEPEKRLLPQVPRHPVFQRLHDPGPVPLPAEDAVFPHQLAGGGPGLQHQTDQLCPQPAAHVRAVCRRPQKVRRAGDARQARGKLRLPGGGLQRDESGAPPGCAPGFAPIAHGVVQLKEVSPP